VKQNYLTIMAYLHVCLCSYILNFSSSNLTLSCDIILSHLVIRSEKVPEIHGLGQRHGKISRNYYYEDSTQVFFLADNLVPCVVFLCVFL